MATPFDGDGESTSRPRASSPPTCSSTAPTASSSPAATGEAATLDDAEQIDLLRAVASEVGRAPADLRHRHQRHPPLGRADQGRRRGRRRRGARRHALLQQAEPGRACGPTSRRSPRRTEIADDPLQHPRADGDQRPARQLAELAEIENVVAVKQANNDELRADRGPRRPRRERRHLPARRSRSAGPAGSASPPTSSGRRWRDLDAAQAGEMDAGREIDAALQPLYDALTRDHQPDPGQGSTGDARLISSERMRLPMVRLDDEQRAVVRDALDAARPRGGLGDERRKLRVLPLGGLGEIGKNMTVVEYDGRIVVVDTGPDVPDRRDARDRPRAARLLLPARPRRRHRGDRPHPRPRGPRRRAALRAARDRHAAGDLRRPADDRHGPLEARRAQAQRRAAARTCGRARGQGRALRARDDPHVALDPRRVRRRRSPPSSARS